MPLRIELNSWWKWSLQAHLDQNGWRRSVGYYQCHSWPYNPIHICFHVYVLTFYVYVFICENKDDDDDDDENCVNRFKRWRGQSNTVALSSAHPLWLINASSYRRIDVQNIGNQWHSLNLWSTYAALKSWNAWLTYTDTKLHVSFMRICDCRIFRIFQQSAHIAYFPS